MIMWLSFFFWINLFLFDVIVLRVVMDGWVVMYDEGEYYWLWVLF